MIRLHHKLQHIRKDRAGANPTLLNRGHPTHRHLSGHHRPCLNQHQLSRQRQVACQATLDDPEIQQLVKKMEAMRGPPPQNSDKLAKALQKIDEVNSKDPTKVQGQPYRVLYSNWLIEWVKKLEPQASDELLILAKGRNIESWRLSEIKRDDYSPNAAGQLQWERDRKAWLAARLVSVMREAGYDERSIKTVEEVMLDRNIPDPRDIRRYDLVGPLGLTNYKVLEMACMLQVLRDAGALVFMERNFLEMFSRMKADEVVELLRRELTNISNKCILTLMSMPWNQVQRKLISQALPPPRRLNTIIKEIEGVSASSTHPGDWRFQNFDYD